VNNSNSKSKCGDPNFCYCAYHQIECHDWCVCKASHTLSPSAVTATSSTTSISAVATSTVDNHHDNGSSIEQIHSNNSNSLSLACSTSSATSTTPLNFQENNYSIQRYVSTTKNNSYGLRIIQVVNSFIFIWKAMSFISFPGAV